MFNQSIADEICAQLEEGKSLRKAAEACGTSARTVLNWTKQSESFFTQYTRAREIGYRLLADELLEIADTPMLGIETKTKEDGTKETTEGDMLGHRKLQIDSRKWMLSKMLPKVYGDKLDIGGQADNPLKTAVEFTWKA